MYLVIFIHLFILYIYIFFLFTRFITMIGRQVNLFNVHADVDVAYAELTTNARSTVSLVNGSAAFSCCSNTSRTIHWHFTYPQNNDVHVVYNGHSVHPDLESFFDVRFNSRTGCSFLEISSARSDDAGTYYCLESFTARRKLHFELILLGQYQVCISY